MKFFTSRFVLVAIICVAFFLRIYHVDINPPSISWDEASIGYNAYSILKTGKDEHGVFMPLDTFAAFGDYKPPIPIYLTVPFIALFGLTELAVRLPSVLAGTITVWILYLFVLELFKSPSIKIQASSKFKAQISTLDTWNLPTAIAIISAALLAITPWHIMLSRAGFEANIALLFIVLGAWLTLRAVQFPTLLYICWLPFVAGIYTFNSARYAGPMIALGVAWYVRKTFFSHRQKMSVGILIAALCLLPILPHLLSKQSRLRFAEVSIFTDLHTVLIANNRQQIDGGNMISKALHNRRIGYGREYLIHFFDHFEPRFLFVHGDGNPKFSIQDSGELLMLSAPFLVYGILAMFSQYPQVAWLLIWWLLVSIAPAAVARETPHALRTENALPIWLIFTAFGIVSTVIYQVSRKRQVLLLTVYCLLLTVNFAYFWHTLISHYPKEYSGEWQYGYKNAIQLAESLRDNYDTIVLTESIGRPYIYVLFYGQSDPKHFWKTKDASFDAAGFYNVYGFDKYRFTKQGGKKYSGKVLYILSPKDVPHSAHIVDTIRLLNGNPILVAFD